MSASVTPLRIIALEGTEGSGKSTQAAMLRDRLMTSGRSAIVVNELRHPLGAPALDCIRQAPEDWEAALHAIHTARLAIQQEVVAPALARGSVVIYDRYTLTTFAMQVCALSGLLGADLFYRQLKQVLRPDLFIYYQILPEEVSQVLTRSADRAQNISFDQESYVRCFVEGYETAVARPELTRTTPTITLSAMGDIASVHQQTWRAIKYT